MDICIFGAFDYCLSTIGSVVACTVLGVRDWIDIQEPVLSCSNCRSGHIPQNAHEATVYIRQSLLLFFVIDLNVGIARRQSGIGQAVQ